jgi:hypothetical protein
VNATDDGQASIYFDLKEYMSSSEYYRVQFVKEQLFLYFGMVKDLTFDINFKNSNNKLTSNFKLPIVITPLAAIEVNTSVAMNDFLIDVTLPLIPSVTSFVKGPVYTIEVLPNSAGITMVKNRVNPVLPSLVPTRLAANPTPTSVLSQSIQNGEVHYLDADKAFVLYLNSSYHCTCFLTWPANLDIKSFRAIRSKDSLDKVFLVYWTGVAAYRNWIKISTKTCGQGTTLRYMHDTVDTALIIPASGNYILSPVNATLPSKDWEFVIAILDKGVNSTYLYSDAVQATPDPEPFYLSVTDAETNPTPSIDPYVNIGGYIDCTTIITNSTFPTQRTLGICLTSKSSSGETQEIITINLNPQIIVPSIRISNVSLPGTDFAQARSLSCVFLSSERISCAIALGLTSFKQIFLNYYSDPTDTFRYNFTIDSTINTYTSVVPYQQLLTIHSTDYILVYAKKRQGAFVLDDVFVTIYKIGDTVQYYGLDLGVYPMANTFVYGFFCQQRNVFYFYDVNTNTMRLFEISEVQLRFASPLLTSLSGTLRFSNSMLSTQVADINLPTVFKPQVFYVPPPPPETTPLWKTYWWVPLLILILIISLYYIRRYWNIIQEKRKAERLKKEVVLTNLKDFYY